MEISLQPEILGVIGGMPITNSLVLSVITTLFLTVVGYLIARSLRLIPTKAQNGAEIIVTGLLDFVANIMGDKKKAREVFPLIITIFLFVLSNNWIGLLPGVSSVGTKSEDKLIAFFRSANSDLNTTLALALIAVVAVQWYGIKHLGLFQHLARFFIFNKGPIHFFVGILELLSEFTKVLSFSFRLFGNVFAGEVLLMVTMTLVPILVPLPFFALELFVGLIQALIFAVLTVIFLKIASESAHA